jgi:acyl dehydratase
MVRLDPTTDLTGWIGREVAVSEWVQITQGMIDTFADVTRDPQWIHVDPVRAAKETPYGGTIAHGFLTLSMLPCLYHTCIEIEPRRMGINVGLNRMRFTSPVKFDSRVRGRLAIAKIEKIDGGIQLTWNATVEIEGSDKPALVAEWLNRALI